GNHDEVFRRIERLPGAEELARERRRQHAAGGSAGAVQHHHRLALRIADGRVREPKLRQGLAGVEPEIGNRPRDFLRRAVVWCQRDAARQRGDGGQQTFHASLPPMTFSAGSGTRSLCCSSAALMNEVKSGCPSRGVEVNSGWYCTPTNHGWSCSSEISVRSSALVFALMHSPADSRRDT